MTDKVGVNPNTISQAANALEKLRDALETNVPVIMKTMNAYWNDGMGDSFDLSALHKAQTHSVDDAAGMRERSRAAQNWIHQHIGLANLSVATIPWDTKDLPPADAKYDAQTLSQAESESKSDPQLARQQIQAVQYDIQYHLDTHDTKWLQDFYSQAGPSVTNLAQTLHDLHRGDKNQNYQNKFLVLTNEDGKSLKTFGTGLAEADKTGLSPQVIQSYSNPTNSWSASMLLKFGPDGSKFATGESKTQENKYGTSLLALLTNKIYQDSQNGKLKIPVGFGGRIDNYGPADRNKLQNTLNDYDPLTAAMNADAQNKHASWQVMGGPDGTGLAKMLLGGKKGVAGQWIQDPWNTKGQRDEYFTMVPPGKPLPMEVPEGKPAPSKNQIRFSTNATPNQKVVGAFLNAATSANRGHTHDALLSSKAAINIITNTAPPTFTGDRRIANRVKPSYDPAVMKALTSTFLRYLPDIAIESSYPYSTANKPYQNWKVDGHPNMIHLTNNVISTFLQEVSSTPENYGSLKGIVANKLGSAYARQLQGLKDESFGTQPEDYSGLYGRFLKEDGILNYKGAKHTDEKDAEVNAVINLGVEAAGSLPRVGKIVSSIDDLDKALGPLGAPQYQLDTNNKKRALEIVRNNFRTQADAVAVFSTVQGLIHQKLIKPEKGWYHDGKIVYNQQFVDWWKYDARPKILRNRTLGENTTVDELSTTIYQAVRKDQ